MPDVSRLNLDNSWIEDGLRKWRSYYSNCIIYETADPVRLEQLKFMLPKYDDLKKHSLYIFDNWKGLTNLTASGEEKPFATQPKGIFGDVIGQAGGNEIRELREALRIMDPILRTSCAVLIITNISESDEKNTKVQAALRSWAHDPNILMKHSLVILVVADSSKIIDEHTRKFVITMPIGLSNEDERNRIIEYCLKTFNLTGNNKEEEQAITRLTSGLDIHQIESILRESWYLNKKFDPVTVKIAKTELVKGTGVLEIVYPGYGFEAVGGYNSVKTFVKENIISVLQDTQRAEILGVPTPRGILFFGPPRTGKTLFSKSLAKELSIPFLNFNTEDIFSKWLGESGQKMKQAIRIVNQMGLCILYIDEIDRFGKRSSASADGASEETRRVFSQLLEWLGDKERKAMIIGTTNVPKDLDPAFLGCGRFDYKIPFLYPGKEARNQILRIHLGLEESGTKKPPPIELGARALNSLLDDIVEKTKYFNGAELEELTNRIRRNALNRRNSKSLIKEDFEEALRHFQVDKIKRIEEMKGYLEDSKSLTDDPIFLEEFQEVNQ